MSIEVLKTSSTTMEGNKKKNTEKNLGNFIFFKFFFSFISKLYSLIYRNAQFMGSGRF